MAKKADWIWMPHNAHFILGHKCRFVLATHVGNYIVSTVGELDNDSAVKHIHSRIHDPEWDSANAHLKGDVWDHAYFKRFGWDELGLDRTYETMVFKATPSELDCCPYRIDSGHDIDSEGYTNAKDANEGHMKLCKKWARRK